jgi:hypothetical protein
MGTAAASNLRPVEGTERFWTSRLRWRLRGAWQWPAFALLTGADALILHLLPPIGAEIDVPLGLILASFGNLFLVGAVAPWLARRLDERERRAHPSVPDDALTPREVILDRTATTVLVVAALGLVAAGLGNRHTVVSETEATETNAELVRDYVLSRGSAEARRNLDNANTRRLAEGFFRTCVNLDDRTGAFCMYVDTKARTVRPDPDRTPNAEFAR